MRKERILISFKFPVTGSVIFPATLLAMVWATLSDILSNPNTLSHAMAEWLLKNSHIYGRLWFSEKLILVLCKIYWRAISSEKSTSTNRTASEISRQRWSKCTGSHLLMFDSPLRTSRWQNYQLSLKVQDRTPFINCQHIFLICIQ